MSAAPEVAEITPDLFIWYRYNTTVKAELFSTGLRGSTGWWLIDAIAINDELIEAATGGTKIAGIFVTNANHPRSAAELSVRFGVPVHAHPDAEIPAEMKIASHTAMADALEIIPIAGAPSGEIAIFSEGNGGTLVIGDALINMEGYGFTFLPAKYCEDAKLMRKSLRRLLEFKFERLLFAHGAPIISGARRRLAALLEGAA
jgi:hypothetical protein